MMMILIIIIIIIIIIITTINNNFKTICLITAAVYKHVRQKQKC